MAQPKPIARTITRIVERTDNPVYFVNLEHQIVFANQATADWTGLSVDELRASPISQASKLAAGSADHRRQGLAPPAELLSGDASKFQTSQQAFQIWKPVAGSGDSEPAGTLFCPAVAQVIYESRSPT